MDLKLLLAIFAGKLIALIIRIFGKTGATTAPGLFALKVDPQLVKKLSKQIQSGSIIISGTNGKTTTTRLISTILSKKYNIIHNRAGSNLLRGIASTLTSKSSLIGKLKSNLAIWEVDEATLPEAIENTAPKIIVLLNLFRDQLDRYGEVDSIRTKWQKSLSRLPKSSTLILNADDPGISFLTKSFRGKVIYFGIYDKQIDLPKIANVADIKHCLNCQSSLKYTALLSAHMGHYTCPNCTFKRPNPNITASNLIFNPNFSTTANLTIDYSPFTLFDSSKIRSRIHYNLPGLYNVYNVLAALCIANIFKIDHKISKDAIEKYTSAFGRFQKIKINNKNIIIFLIKNPAGANEVIRILGQKDKLNLLLILNDNIADGRDVSWTWDTDWELLTSKTKKVQIAGTRAWDLATRLKYAGYKLSKNNIYRKIYYSIKQALKNMNKKDTLLVLPTYTAMLEVQKSLNKMGGKTQWQNQ